jgi:hypothetical protein
MADKIPEGWIIEAPQQDKPAAESSPAGSMGIPPGWIVEAPARSEQYGPPTPVMSRLEAAKLGYLSGASANFGDEVYGLSKASGLPDWLGGFRAPVGAARMLYGQTTTPNPEFMKSYEEAVAARRAQNKAAETEYPGTYLTGQIGGSLLTPGATSLKAATLPVRMAKGAGYGAVYGGVSGLGAGENDVDRLKQGAMGAVFGGVTGAAAPAAVETVLTAGRAATAPISSAIRGAINSKKEANRLVDTALATDMRIDPAARTRLTPQEFAGNVTQGGPATVMDLGSQTTRDLARTATNASPEAEQTFNSMINPRFETQSNRVSDFLRQRFRSPQQQAANDAAYRRAYEAGSGSIGSPELERLASSNTVASAMKTAVAKAEDEAVIGGYGAMNPRVTFTPDGRVQFQRSPSGMPVFPDLQFWDLTRREIGDAAKEAARAGRDSEARRLGNFARGINKELDKLVPEYAQARQGAMPYTAASRLINRIEKIPERQNVVNRFAESIPANADLNRAFGKSGADEIRNVRRVESIMDSARQSVQGNSTTVKQLQRLKELGYYSVAGGIGGYGAYNQDPAQIAGGAIAAGLIAGRGHVNQNVMRHVAEILTSQDPGRTGRQAITQQIMQNPNALAAITKQAMTNAQTRSQMSERRSALVRRLLERSIVGGATPSILQ